LYFEINKVAVKLNQFWDLGGNLRKNGTLFKNKKKITAEINTSFFKKCTLEGGKGL